ncbi:hypothetical protein [uncultured Desulfosarcina sp.]|uniref:hypothetical protein n=1 Tax=uncultured Desulfosarcina sp. TaxID=218289 RepID=UPI0029C7DA52|nr:hypothetical protein [uncultured Desulfosarcina sp.]
MPAHDNYFVIQTTPATLMREEGKQQEIFKNLSKYPSAMIFYSPLSLHKELFKDLNAALPPDMPCAIVFWAGYPEKERILRGTIADRQTGYGHAQSYNTALEIVYEDQISGARLLIMGKLRWVRLIPRTKSDGPPDSSV